ncbi:MAG: hypothetical protein O6705_02055 [Actinobacteria bacterium]|nr:hypothetical protein [Actinomycetota bacterium]
MRRDLAGIDEGNPLSRGPSGPLRSSKSGKPEAKRIERDLAFAEEENPLSRGPSGPLRSSKSGQNQTTSVATTHSASTDLTNTKRTAAVGNLRLPTIAAP